MHALKRLAVTATAALCLLSPLLPQTALAETHSLALQSDSDAPEALPVKSGLKKKLKTVQEPIETENAELIAQIRETYKAAKKASRVKSFKGKCGAYVARQLVLLGVNKKYVGSNGNRAFDIYRAMKETTGGYAITAYPAKKYTLKAALEAIAAEDPHARNILVGFEKGTSKAGKRYGHVLLIHGIENGKVYFSDSYAQTVEGKRYKEGEPIVCSIDTFVKLYKKYKLDGVIHFS